MLWWNSCNITMGHFNHSYLKVGLRQLYSPPPAARTEAPASPRLTDAHCHVFGDDRLSGHQVLAPCALVCLSPVADGDEPFHVFTGRSSIFHWRNHPSVLLSILQLGGFCLCCWDGRVCVCSGSESRIRYVVGKYLLPSVVFSLSSLSLFHCKCPSTQCTAVHSHCFLNRSRGEVESEPANIIECLLNRRQSAGSWHFTLWVHSERYARRAV